ncbi:hypothetical protein BV25DRAFT_1638819 [Artomyces pyxidatus]|uniref:Uncharacterized protein n=1 Tax=Artomyces pyxidatus TaxID=48021 RepID=A0ACB8SJ80_9AGAM|nr:hypothetical protein BV25DRAFT_1638819 [Artomyces pyxidatus]
MAYSRLRPWTTPSADDHESPRLSIDISLVYNKRVDPHLAIVRLLWSWLPASHSSTYPRTSGFGYSHPTTSARTVSFLFSSIKPHLLYRRTARKELYHLKSPADRTHCHNPVPAQTAHSSPNTSKPRAPGGAPDLRNRLTLCQGMSEAAYSVRRRRSGQSERPHLPVAATHRRTATILRQAAAPADMRADRGATSPVKLEPVCPRTSLDLC